MKFGMGSEIQTAIAINALGMKLTDEQQGVGIKQAMVAVPNLSHIPNMPHTL